MPAKFGTKAQQRLRWATVITIDMGRKKGGAVCPFRGELEPRLIQCGLGRGLLPYHVASSSIQPFGHNKHGPKTGWCCALCFWATAYFDIKWHLGPSSRLFMEMGRKLGLCPFRGAELGPHLTQCRLGRGLSPYQLAS